MAHGSRQALTVAPKLAARESALLAATLLWLVLGALLGGLLLNLMPSVFPVLAIKALRKWGGKAPFRLEIAHKRLDRRAEVQVEGLTSNLRADSRQFLSEAWRGEIDYRAPHRQGLALKRVAQLQTDPSESTLQLF
jgi:hypothetical protein